MASEGEIQDEREGPTGGGEGEEPGVMAIPGPVEMASIQWPKRMPVDRTAYNIMLLHALHANGLPALEFTAAELDELGAAQRDGMLKEIKDRLGIKPTLKRMLE